MMAGFCNFAVKQASDISTDRLFKSCCSVTIVRVGGGGVEEGVKDGRGSICVNMQLLGGHHTVLQNYTQVPVWNIDSTIDWVLDQLKIWSGC